MHKTSPLTPGDPADGADGADVMLICDPSVDTLLHLHKRKTYTAPRGANGNPAAHACASEGGGWSETASCGCQGPGRTEGCGGLYVGGHC